MIYITLTTAITFASGIQRALATIGTARKYVDKRKMLKTRYPPPWGIFKCLTNCPQQLHSMLYCLPYSTLAMRDLDAVTCDFAADTILVAYY